jgi:hypothetical protein
MFRADECWSVKRSILVVFGIALASLFAGCATTPVTTLAPVGPNPMGYQSTVADGQLQVFTALSGHAEGSNPTWYRHTDYEIYSQTHRFEHVQNNLGHYSQGPRVVTLPAGEYVVEARAKGTLQVRVPVVIKPGELTSVHLDGAWQPSQGTDNSQLVMAPAGYPVGWRADAR